MGSGMSRRFHLGWFTNFTAGSWDATFSHGGSPWDGRFFVDMAQALERALRLRHLRGQIAGARGLSGLDRDDAEIRPAGAQARPGAARRDGRGRDVASRRAL